MKLLRRVKFMATNLDMLELMKRVKADPTQMQAVIMDMCETTSKGIVRVVDPSNPFAFAIETIACMGVAIINEIPLALRKSYKMLAQQPEDIYPHMSDGDYKDIFAVPAMGHMKVLLKVESIYKYAVPVSENSSVRKLTFPKHTEFTVASTEFTMQYPVDIVVMENDSISVHYDLGEENGLIDVKEHTIKQSIRYNGPTAYLEIAIPTIQAKLNSFTAKLNATAQFLRTYNFKDKFYHCRAYLKDDVSSNWTEISVTHNPNVYDLNIPTVCLKVMSGYVEVSIPQIYFNNGLIKDSVRIDIYTTRGPIEMVMTNYTIDKAYKATWRDLDTVKTSPFSAPLNIFPDFMIYSDEIVVGGSNGINFNKLRDQVINGRRDRDGKIITENHLKTVVNARGYDLMLDIDNLTNREYVASKEIPSPTDGSTSTGMGCVISTLSTDMSVMYLHDTVRDHNYRVTIMPDTLYKLSNGILSIVDSDITNSLKEMAFNTPDALANLVNNENYLFTPLHYVLDITTETFATRAYYLTDPKIKSVYYKQSNDTIGLAASVQNYEMEYRSTGEGYRIAVEYVGSSSFMKLNPAQIHVQLHYQGQSGKVIINGKLASTIDTQTNRPVDGRYIYIFDIPTTFDIDINNNIILTDSTTINLDTTFDLVMAVEGYLPTGAMRSSIDNIFNPQLVDGYNLNAIYYAFMHEQINIVFGEHLSGLWTRSRTVNDSSRWLLYEENVPAVWDYTEFERDEQNRILFDSKQKPIVKHNKGDPRLDENGLPAYDHYKGDVMYDEFGDPLIKGGTRAMLRQFDMVLFDGIYYFANSEVTLNYVKTAMGAVSTWANVDIPLLSGELINVTKLLLCPKTTIGNITIYSESSIIEVNAYQDLHIRYHMKTDRYRNTEIRNKISESTGSIITNILSNRTISKDDIISALRENIGADVISIELDGFMENNFNTVTLTDTSMAPSIGKRLVVDTDGTLIVEDSLSIEFIEQTHA